MAQIVKAVDPEKTTLSIWLERNPVSHPDP
jgi:hypothetical protein